MADRNSEFTELKSKMLARIKREGRFADFDKRRKAFKIESNLPAFLVDVAVGILTEFAPLDGSAPEFTQRDYEDRLAQFMGTPTASTPEAATAALATTKAVNTANRAMSDDDKWENLRRRVAAAVKSGRSRVSDDEGSMARWIIKRAGTPVEEIDTLEVPGEGAVKLLRRVHDNERAYDDFISGCFTKLMTKAVDNNQVGGYEDDGRKQLSAMDKLDAVDPDADNASVLSLLSGVEDEPIDETSVTDADPEEPISEPVESPERPEGESGVPPEGVEGGGGI